MINLSIAGRVGKDATLRAVGSDSVLSFSVACDYYAGKAGKQTLWVRCSMWGKRAESLVQHVVKGATVGVCGSMTLREYDGKTSVELRVAELTLLGGKSDRQQPQSNPFAGSKPPGDKSPFGNGSGTNDGGFGDDPVDDFGDDSSIPF
jgi:single-strand DNA-binding protein